MTGSPAFDTVYENLLRLKDSNIPVIITITPNIYMIHDMERIFKLVSSLKIPCFTNAALFEPREETGRKIQDLSYREYADIFKMLKVKGSSELISIDENELPDCGRGGIPTFGIRCGAGRSSFNVSWDGIITACFNLDSLKVSLLDHSFSDAWEKIHSDVQSYPLPVECNGCAYDKVCINCVAYRCMGAEKGHCNPLVCKRTRLLVKEGISQL